MNYGAIGIDPEVMSGTPVFTGTRVPVKTLLDYLKSGDDISLFLEHYPSLTLKAARAVLAMAAHSLTSRKVLDENFERKMENHYNLFQGINSMYS